MKQSNRNATALIQQVTFLTDNPTLAKTAAAQKKSDAQVPWELRE
jgi:hypothetical protein